MPVQTKARARISAAAEATDAVLKCVDAAERELKAFDGRIINGAGVFHDLSARRIALASAIRELKTASAILDAATWPTDADYDQ